MDDLNDKMKERWENRRKKSYNWTKLLIMLGALVAILWGMTQLNKTSDKVNWTDSAEKVETPAVHESGGEQNP
ncbi:MAG: hypothetical protein U1C33_01180 [Candidatus Cloacimonadaceae bacterium]|nr:hypothetical protein [Candidatus Cloacimonadaceae bacterium]